MSEAEVNPIMIGYTKNYPIELILFLNPDGTLQWFRGTLEYGKAYDVGIIDSESPVWNTMVWVI